MNERDYERGSRQAWVTLLRYSLRELGYDVADRDAARLALEREEAIAALRTVCEEFGDNEWEASLHLADIIDKHLARPLHANRSVDR